MENIIQIFANSLMRKPGTFAGVTGKQMSTFAVYGTESETKTHRMNSPTRAALRRNEPGNKQ